MLEIKIYIYLFLIVYFSIINYYYLNKYFKKKIKSFGNNNTKKKFLILFSPFIILFLHLIFSVSINFYNDIISHKLEVYDQRFNIVNEEEYELNFLVNIYDTKAKKWVPFYDNNNLRFSPIIKVPPKTNIKYLLYLDKKNDVVYDKISFLYLNDFKINKYPDTLINAINFNLPSNPIKVYDYDFYYKKKSINKTEVNKIFYGIEILQLVSYLSFIIIFLLFSFFEKHKIWKFIVWLFSLLVISISSYMIYNLVIYLLLVIFKIIII